MGLDLCMMPFPKRHIEQGFAFSHTLLDVNRSSELFTVILGIEEKHGQPVPDDFRSFRSRDDKYEDSHYGVTTTTPYGERLQYLPVAVLRSVCDHEHVTDNSQNRAVWAYLAALGDDWFIALYWD